MRELIKALNKFKQNDYKDKEELYKSLKSGQTPHTLFISCCDSRILTSPLTQSEPGEIFIHRNIANIVPPFSEASKHTGSSSVIEYAVQILNVKQIVICGHSNCGGCAALHNSSNPEIPLTQEWLGFSAVIMKDVKAQHALRPDKNIFRITEELNVLEQVKNLRTYPYVKEKENKGEIHLYAWHYDIASGNVKQWDGSNFQKIN